MSNAGGSRPSPWGDPVAPAGAAGTATRRPRPVVTPTHGRAPAWPEPVGARPRTQLAETTVVRLTRRDRRRVRLVERFSGRRVRAKVGVWRRVRSFVLLLVLGAILAAVVAAILAAVVAGIGLAIHHLSKG